MTRGQFGRDGASGSGMLLASGWLAFCLAALLALPLSAAERHRSAASLHVRQLSTPFPVVERPRWRRGPSARYGIAPKRYHGRRAPPSAPRRARAPSPFQAQQLRARRPIRGAGNAERALLRYQPARSYLIRRHLRGQIDVDQLLTVPRADGFDDGRLDELMALGIPVIRGVPPIVVVDPQRNRPGKEFRRGLH
jgi:hypothetical protein